MDTSKGNCCQCGKNGFPLYENYGVYVCSQCLTLQMMRYIETKAREREELITDLFKAYVKLEDDVKFLSQQFYKTLQMVFNLHELINLKNKETQTDEKTQ